MTSPRASGRAVEILPARPRRRPGWTCNRCGEHLRPAPGQVVAAFAQHATTCPALAGYEPDHTPNPRPRGDPA